MSDLKKAMADLSEKEISRKQFLGLIGGGLFSMVGAFRVMQAINTPTSEKDDLATTREEVFGAREYGYVGSPSPVASLDEQSMPRFGEDIFS